MKLSGKLQIWLSAKVVKDRAIKMSTNITTQRIEDISSTLPYSVAYDKSSDVNDTKQITLLYRYVNSDGPQEEMIKLIPLKGQTQGEDICGLL